VRVVVAPDKFKGSLPAVGVTAAIAAGLRRVRADVQVVQVPVADGGEGTVDAAIAAGFRAVRVAATGPTGEPVAATYARRGETAVVELADVVGLGRLPSGRLEPLHATTYGLGTVLRHAVGDGATEIVLGVGGSASTDGGVGMLQALGVRFVDASGTDLRSGGAALCDLAAIDLSGLDEDIRSARFVVASDVDNPLYGPHGAAAVYGPQKGADAADVALLDTGLRRLAEVASASGIADLAGSPGAGAAGGAGFGAMAFLAARLEPGIRLLLDLVGFDDIVAGADLVITGEGSLDQQTLRGKVPVGVAAAAARHDVPVVAVAGRCRLAKDDLTTVGIRGAYALSSLEPDVAVSMRDAARLLEQLAGRIGAEWLT
jgi:glycerate 2-kinase